MRKAPNSFLPIKVAAMRAVAVATLSLGAAAITHGRRRDIERLRQAWTNWLLTLATSGSLDDSRATKKKPSPGLDPCMRFDELPLDQLYRAQQRRHLPSSTMQLETKSKVENLYAKFKRLGDGLKLLQSSTKLQSRLVETRELFELALVIACWIVLPELLGRGILVTMS